MSEGIYVFKERKHGGRDLSDRSSHKASNALRGQGSWFKTFGNSQILLAESMEAMTEFISSQDASKAKNDASKVAVLTVDGDTTS